MALDPHHTDPSSMNWWQLLWYSPTLFFLFLFKKIRSLIWDKLKDILGMAEKDYITRPEYEADKKEAAEDDREMRKMILDGQQQIRQTISDSEERIQAAFHGSVAEYKKSVTEYVNQQLQRDAQQEERWNDRFVMLEKTLLDTRLKGTGT